MPCCIQVNAQDEAQAAQLQGDIVDMHTRLQDLQIACGRLQEQAAALQGKIDEIGGPALKQQRALVVQLQKARTCCS